MPQLETTHRSPRIWRALGVGLALLGCLSSCSEDDANSDGNISASGGAVGTASGGNAAATGGNAAATGGNAAATGGNAAATGGNAAATGGNAAAMGGNAAASGGNAASAGGAASTGPASSLPSGAAAEFVAATNAVRAAVTQPSNYTGTWAPLPNVTWSDTVAASAQAWADHLAQTNNCGLEHEDQNTYGENLAAGSNLSPTSAVTMWAGEKNLYTWSAKYSMADFNAGSGHYTQLVWRTSIQIGCGSASCGRSVVISCRYSPAGNMIGTPVY